MFPVDKTVTGASTIDMLQKDYTVPNCVKSLVTRLIFGNIELKPIWDF